jgi:hypothetical protein
MTRLNVVTALSSLQPIFMVFNYCVETDICVIT